MPLLAPRLLYLAGIDLPMPQARVIQSLHTARALAAQGCRVSVAVGRAPRHGLTECLAGYGVEPHPNLRILALPTLRLPRLPVRAYVHPRLAAWNWSYGLAALLAARLLPPAWRPDLALARDPRLAWLFLRARRFGAPLVVYEVHELFSTRARERDEAPSGETPRTKTPRVRGVEAEALAGAHRVLTLTAACKALLEREFGIPPERVLVAPDAVARVPDQLGPLPRTREIAYAGQLYPWKGVGTLVRALALLPEARLRIVGGMPDGDEHGRELQTLVSELGLAEQVRFPGFVPHSRVPAAVEGCAAAAVPLPDTPMSRYFTSPLKVFEYMAAGLPIVASDLPAMREVLRDQENALLVPPDDPSALAGALRRLLDDRDLAERLRRQAHADVRRHTWDARAAAIVRFLE